ncbi:hypothetical protein PG985_014237 [Apiospora marii]|uniref:uncharacterized protein n=1 Tax=Apiospora marii TaxID=335849 RepID=UPI00312F7662
MYAIPPAGGQAKTRFEKTGVPPDKAAETGKLIAKLASRIGKVSHLTQRRNAKLTYHLRRWFTDKLGWVMGDYDDTDLTEKAGKWAEKSHLSITRRLRGGRITFLAKERRLIQANQSFEDPSDVVVLIVLGSE